MIRHAHSTANNYQGAASARTKHARLDREGIREARALAHILPSKYGITPSETEIAVSQFRRTKQTAQVMHFKRMTPYPQLNEVDPGGESEANRALLARRILPDGIIEAAEKLLRKPPPEPVWLTHGLLIAGLCTLGRTLIKLPRDIPVPFTCEVRLVEIRV